MRHGLRGVEVQVVGRNFDAAPPAARAVEHLGTWVRNGDAIDIELVIVKALILSVRDAFPYAVLTLGHGIADAADIEQYALGVWRPEDGAHASLRVDLGILFARLVQRGGFEILHWWGFVDLNRRLPAPAPLRCLGRLGDCRDNREDSYKSETQNR